MRMRKYLIPLAAVLLAACTANESPDSVNLEKDAPRQALTFTADAVISKTMLGADWSVSWNEGDPVKILWNGGEAICEAELEEGKARFNAVVDDVKEYYAVYPASVPAQVGADGKIVIDLPSAQNGSFEDNAVIVAYTTREALNFGRFKSAVGMIRFAITDPTVTKVRFSAADGKPVSGSVTAGPKLAYTTVPGVASVDVAVKGAGTYFLSVLPGLELSGLNFQLGNDEKWYGTASSYTPAAIDAGQILLVTASLEDNLVVEGDIYITEPAALRSLLSNPASASRLDGSTVRVKAGTYDLSVEGKGLSLDFDQAVTLKIVAGEGTVFTTSLSGDEGCILTVASDNVNLDVEGVTFTGGSHNGPGGALNLTKGKHVFRNCTFDRNVSTSASVDKTGGAVNVGGTAEADFEGCSFTDNRATVTGGGALAVYTTGVVRVLDCTFTGNVSHSGTAYVGNGGAILQKILQEKDGNILYVANSRFSGNGTLNNGSDIFSSAGEALLMYNNTFAHPLNPTPESWNRGLVRANVPALAVNCTFVLQVDAVTEGAGCNNGAMAFGQNSDNVIMGNLLLGNAGYAMGVGSKYTSSTTKQATTAGYNVYSEAPKIVFTDTGGNTDVTGIRTANIVSSDALAADGLLHWEGPAVKLPSYQAPTPAQVESVIKAYPVDGENFYDWLVAKGIFGKDAAGNDRGGSWWPGAYQGKE